ncbi:hypothetical protein AK812_SmicGene4220 [Symbiodinium microadriaticum]|uniref:Uncharacterized protein n=1 Tax=Symbiodinium microadriaticum TaxID=2951 RepID=A0A1Q9EWT4_SYMMI|nr:hypothetical protein AK812_SmicGene4220 [Symbiodinium microadriaticum]
MEHGVLRTVNSAVEAQLLAVETRWKSEDERWQEMDKQVTELREQTKLIEANLTQRLEDSPDRLAERLAQRLGILMEEKLKSNKNFGGEGAQARATSKAAARGAAEEATERFLAGIEPRFDHVLQEMKRGTGVEVGCQRAMEKPMTDLEENLKGFLKEVLSAESEMRKLQNEEPIDCLCTPQQRSFPKSSPALAMAVGKGKGAKGAKGGRAGQQVRKTAVKQSAPSHVPPATVKIRKKVNWLNREGLCDPGFFGPVRCRRFKVQVLSLQISSLLELEAAVQALAPVAVGTSEASSSTDPACLQVDQREELLAEIRRWRAIMDMGDQPIASHAHADSGTQTDVWLAIQLHHLLNVEAAAGMGSLAENDTQDIGCQAGPPLIETIEELEQQLNLLRMAGHDCDAKKKRFAAYFGKQFVDEDALEMLGTLPEERAMSVLENLEGKAEYGEIWNPNSCFFGEAEIDEDAVEMLGGLPIDRAMSILENIEGKADAGEIWNPNSYIVKAVVRHSQNLKQASEPWPAKGGKKGGGAGAWAVAVKPQSGGKRGKGYGK